MDVKRKEDRGYSFRFANDLGNGRGGLREDGRGVYAVQAHVSGQVQARHLRSITLCSALQNPSCYPCLSLFLLSTYSGSLGIESFCPKYPLGVFVNTSERRLRKYKICYKYMVIVFEHIIIHDNFYFSSK